MWIEAIVMPREDSKPYRPSPQRDRRAVYQSGCDESLRFRDSVLNYLQSQKLMGAVKWVSEPGSLPMVTLHCHEGVLEQLRQVPQFEAGRSAAVQMGF
ncbi:hypothetical protein [Hyalangium rubrum]|uniref:Uncharacterized protein n=1 Tax=Hyalangium rubrum TaxID=3103134 RepID=A0ABU5GUS9_9BACT|nr:hypothetical protein [Hyalangium sp. s54d21]MDY7224943.1 hypothetical protein [Hyalangium sp. s54d21]